MRILKSHPLLRLVNSYLIDSSEPSNISYLWNFGSLLAVCLVIQIITGVTLAMHYSPNVLEAFNSIEHKYYVEFFTSSLIELLLCENFYISNSTITNLKTITGVTLAMHFIIIKKPSLKEVLEGLGIEVEGLEIDIDDINLDNIDQIIALIKKLLGLDLNYLTLWYIILTLLVILYLAIKNRKQLELDLTPILLRKGNCYYKAIIDLKDPTGYNLKRLYALNSNIQGLVIYCPELTPSRRYCVYSTQPISNIEVSYDILGSDLLDNQEYHISINFVSPNRVLWLLFSSVFDLKISTGFEEYAIAISPDLENLNTIEIRGLLSTYIDNNRPSPPFFDT